MTPPAPTPTRHCHDRAATALIIYKSTCRSAPHDLQGPISAAMTALTRIDWLFHTKRKMVETHDLR